MKRRKDQKNVLTTLFLIVFADMLGFGLIIPLLPYYAKHFGASDILIGILSMTYPLAQIFASPLIGRFSDKYGRKIALLLSVGGTFLSLIVLGLAKSLGPIFISRLIDGLTGGNITVAQSYIGDFTDEKSRSKSFGLIGAAFGLGFILGPAFGGFLSRWGFAVPAFFAAALSFINLINIVLFLPDSKPADNYKEVPYTFEELKRTFSEPKLLSLLFTKLFYSLGFTTFESSFALFAMRKLELDLSKTSLLLAYVGIVIVFTQGFLLGKITKKFDDHTIISYLMPISIVLLALYSFSSNIPGLILLLTPLSISSALMGVSITALTTKSVTKDKLGGTLGIFGSVDSLTRIIGPFLGAVIIQYIGPKYLGLFIGFFVLIGFSIFFIKFIPALKRQQKNEGLILD
ncbi:MAG: MFS transporter [Fervidobacterium sp.]